MGARVQLIHPPHYNSLGDKLDVPLGLLVIASAVREAVPDAEISINDLSGVAMEDWDIGEADIYGMTVYAPSLPTMKDIVRECRAKNPDAIIVIGGAHPSADPHLEDYAVADHVVTGFGEQVMCEIVSKFGNGNGAPRIMHGEFERFYFPAYDLVDLGLYQRTVDGERSIMMLTSRGCPFSCHFCGLSQMHNKADVKFMDAEAFQYHLARIKEMGIKALNIQDDIFTLSEPRLFKILDAIKRFGFKFRCMGRAGYDTEETYEKLAEAGCVQVAWGLESGSQHILDRMNKAATVQDNRDVIRWARKYGITSRAFFVIGFPGETRETMEETRRFIVEADPDQYLVNTMIPYPGTAVWNDPERFGITKLYKDFDEYYQLGKDGMGGLLSFDTEWLTRYEFRKLEVELREWLRKNKEFRGSLLDYEKKFYEVAECRAS
ncbi:MAG: radical SAM protein [Desulfobacterales bacterium]|nr:radical SAM protein [Desulfobacterales bacterium]